VQRSISGKAPVVFEVGEEVDGEHRDEKMSNLWSMLPITSWGDAEEWPEGSDRRRASGEV
jgi:hypothetical protein